MFGLARSLELLVALDAAYQTIGPHDKAREPLYFMRHGGGFDLSHAAFDQTGWEDVDEEMLQELSEQGLIRVDYGGQHTDKISVTSAGSRVAGEARRMLEGDEGEEVEAVDLSWDGVGEPTLKAALEVWLSKGARQDGVLATDIVEKVQSESEVTELSAMRAIAMLKDAGYLENAGALATDFGPALVRVTERGLQAVGGWPATSADAAAKALLAALDEQIADAEGEEKTKLEGFRERAADVGQGLLTELMRRVIFGGEM